MLPPKGQEKKISLNLQQIVTLPAPKPKPVPVTQPIVTPPVPKPPVEKRNRTRSTACKEKSFGSK